MGKLKKMPEFNTEAKEREFWETHDSTDYLNWNQASSASFPKLKPSTLNSTNNLASAAGNPA